MVVSLWRICITFVWLRGSLKVPVASSWSKRHLHLVSIRLCLALLFIISIIKKMLRNFTGFSSLEFTHCKSCCRLKCTGFLSFSFFFRGDHIVPNFEEIWPSKKGKNSAPKRGLEYYYDAMTNGPELSGDFTNSQNFSCLSVCEKYALWI